MLPTLQFPWLTHSPSRDILAVLSTTRSSLTSYLRIRSTATSHTSPELLDSHTEINAALSELTADLQDLLESVKAVESDPYRYGIDVAEVSRRQKVVSDVAREIEGMKGKVEGAKREGERHAGLPDPDAFQSGDEEGEGEGNGYSEFEQQRQLEILEEQDVALDGVFRTVGNLREQADAMGRELEEQGELLDSVDNIADRVGGKLQEGIKRVGKVIRNNEGECFLVGAGQIAVLGRLCRRWIWTSVRLLTH